MWSCHICHSNFPLGATRRCLHDGHYLCAGNTTNKRTRRSKKHKACSSEFDYDGWNKWGRWRRNNTQDQKHVIYRGKDCSNHCDFPSHCQRQNVRIVESINLESALSQQADPATTFDQIIESALTEPDLPVLKRTSSTLGRLIKAAEKRTAQITTMLTPIQEEQLQSETLPSKTLAPKIQAPDFLTFKARMDKIHNPSKKDNEQPVPSVKAANKDDEDIPYPSDESDSEEPSQPNKQTHEAQSPSSTAAAKSHEPFDFDLPLKKATCGEEESQPVSPRRNAWDWTAGDIGAALSPSFIYETFEDILRKTNPKLNV